MRWSKRVMFFLSTFRLRKLFYKWTELQLHEVTMRRFHRRVRDLAMSGELAKLPSY